MTEASFADRTIEAMLAALRDAKPLPGATGVQRISWCFGQVALTKGEMTREEENRLREYAELAVCAKYEEDVARLTADLDAANRTVLAVKQWGQTRAAANLTGIAETSEEDVHDEDELREIRAVNWLAMVADEMANERGS